MSICDCGGGPLPLPFGAVLGRMAAYESIISPPDRYGDRGSRLGGRGFVGKPRISCAERGGLGALLAGTAEADEVLRATPIALGGIFFSSGRRGRGGLVAWLFDKGVACTLVTCFGLSSALWPYPAPAGSRFLLLLLSAGDDREVLGLAFSNLASSSRAR